MIVCWLKKNKILLYSTDPNFKPEVNIDAVIISFNESVNGDKEWEPIIKNSFDRCYHDRIGTVDGFHCDVIPKSFYSVLECAYKEQYLKCPNYNPKKLDNCKETLEYADICYENDYNYY
jgi:hypothetical protein